MTTSLMYGVCRANEEHQVMERLVLKWKDFIQQKALTASVKVTERSTQDHAVSLSISYPFTTFGFNQGCEKKMKRYECIIFSRW